MSTRALKAAIGAFLVLFFVMLCAQVACMVIELAGYARWN